MKKVLFAGGGSGGPVTPLLAVAARLEELDPEIRVFWAGTDEGPERELVGPRGYPYFAVPVAKLPRYLTTKLFLTPIDFLRARRTALSIMKTIHPRAVVSAGGYTAVPIVRAAAAYRVPCISHQLDYIPGLSNRLIAKQSRYVTTSFDYPEPPFGKTVFSYPIPTPTRFAAIDLPPREEACRFFGLDPAKRIMFVTGGGTGAQALNRAIWRIVPTLPEDVQIIHLTGKGKAEPVPFERQGYVLAEFFTDEMLLAYAAADLVVSRAGIGSISELAALSKPVIFVPLPNSPQTANVEALGEGIRVIAQEGAAWVEFLSSTITELLDDIEERQGLGRALHEAFPTDRGETLAELVLSVMV